MGESWDRVGWLPHSSHPEAVPFALCSLFLGGGGGQVAGGRALTFGLLEEGGDAVRVHGSLAQLTSGRKKVSSVVLRDCSSQAQARLDGHVCGIVGRGGQAGGLV